MARQNCYFCRSSGNSKFIALKKPKNPLTRRNIYESSSITFYSGSRTSSQIAKDQTTEMACVNTNETEIARLFDRWNQSLQTGDPDKVVENYADDAILLPIRLKML